MMQTIPFETVMNALTLRNKNDRPIGTTSSTHTQNSDRRLIVLGVLVMVCLLSVADNPQDAIGTHETCLVTVELKVLHDLLKNLPWTVELLQLLPLKSDQVVPPELLRYSDLGTLACGALGRDDTAATLEFVELSLPDKVTEMLISLLVSAGTVQIHDRLDDLLPRHTIVVLVTLPDHILKE